MTRRVDTAAATVNWSWLVVLALRLSLSRIPATDGAESAVRVSRQKSVMWPAASGDWPKVWAPWIGWQHRTVPPWMTGCTGWWRYRRAALMSGRLQLRYLDYPDHPRHS